MRTYIFLAVIFVSVVIVGCSGSSKVPVVPSDSEDNFSLSESISENAQVLFSGTMNLDDGTLEFNDRFLAPYWNVTPYVGSNFSYQITGFTPPNTVNINLRLTNATTITAYDVAIVFENLYGKTVLNPDAYIDIFQMYDVDPIIYFKKGSPIQIFPPGQDNQPLQIKYPGGSPLVDFFIIAHIGGNTGGVVNYIGSSCQGRLFPDGGEATIVTMLKDYQNNISHVIANTTPLTGGITYLDSYNPSTWYKEITNSKSAPAGIYNTLVLASSPSSPSYNTYDYFDIIVYEPGQDPVYFSESDVSIEDDTILEYPQILSSGQHGMAMYREYFFLTFWGTDNMTESAVFFTKSDRYGANWENATNLTSYNNGFREQNPSVTHAEQRLYVVYQTNENGNWDIKLANSPDAGNTWYYHTVTAGSSNHEISPSVGVYDGTNDMVYVAYIDNTAHLLKDAIAESDDLDNWGHYTISDNTWTISPEKPSIQFNNVLNGVQVAWSDTVDGQAGRRIYFDKSTGGKAWGTDTPISDNWIEDYEERDASLAINPLTGLPGIAYMLQLSSDTFQIRFAKGSDMQGSSYQPTKIVSRTSFMYYNNMTPSLWCEESGRWLAAWRYSDSLSQGDIKFNESLDDGQTWGLETVQFVSSGFGDWAFGPVVASDETNVIVAWCDMRNGYYTELFVRRGTHR